MGPMSGMSQPGAAAGGMMGLPGMPGEQIRQETRGATFKHATVLLLFLLGSLPVHVYYTHTCMLCLQTCQRTQSSRLCV